MRGNKCIFVTSFLLRKSLKHERQKKEQSTNLILKKSKHGGIKHLH